MEPAVALELAREGDLERLGLARMEMGDAVRAFADGGDASSALELFGRVWRIWLTSAELETGGEVPAAALAAGALSATCAASVKR